MAISCEKDVNEGNDSVLPGPSEGLGLNNVVDPTLVGVPPPVDVPVVVPRPS